MDFVPQFSAFTSFRINNLFGFLPLGGLQSIRIGIYIREVATR